MQFIKVITMFIRFGFNEQYVRRALAAGDSAEAAYEALERALQIRWGEMCQELSAQDQQELRPLYDRLMCIRMTSRHTNADRRAEAQSRVESMFRNMEREAEQRKAQGLREAFDFAAECRQRMAKQKAEREARRKAKGKPDYVVDVEFEVK